MTGSGTHRRPSRSADRLPLLAAVDRRSVRADLLAAVTVTAVLIPSGLAYGELAGLSPVAGLYTACLGMVGYALLATSRVLIVGPESQMAILVAAALAPLAAGSSSTYAALAAAMALVAAAFCVVAALARLGFLADYLSQPVLVGYLTGVALIIIVNQSAKLIGTSTSGDTLVALLRSLWDNLSDADATSAAVGFGTLALIVLLRRFTPRVPASLVAVVVFTGLSAVLDLSAHGVAVVGSVPRGLPTPAVPDVSFGDLLDLALPALGLVVVVFANTVLTARLYALKDGGYRIDADQELLALAAANVGAGFFGGFPVGASDSRSAVNHASGGRSQLVGVFSAAILAVFLLAFTPAVQDLPLPTLAAIVIVAAWGLLDPAAFHRLYAFRHFESVLAGITLVGVAVLGILPGILVAVAVNLAELVYRLSRPAAAVLGPVEGSTRWRAVSPEAAAAADPAVLVLRYGGPLVFANAEFVVTNVRQQLRRRQGSVRWVVLDCEAVTMVDTNGVQALDQLVELTRRREVTLALARVSGPLEEALRRGGVWEGIGDAHVYDRVEDAVRASHDEPPEHDEPAPHAEPTAED